MGKGDKKTRRGKIIKGSYGKLRTRSKKKTVNTVSSKKKQEKKPA